MDYLSLFKSFFKWDTNIKFLLLFNIIILLVATLFVQSTIEGLKYELKDIKRECEFNADKCKSTIDILIPFEFFRFFIFYET